MAAPDFELPDLTGVRHKLSDVRDRNVLLVFFNPQCGYCTKMAPDLAALPEGGGDRPVPVVVSTGTPRRTGSSSSSMAYGAWSCVRKRWKSPRSSSPRERPWISDRQGGRIASELTVGAEPLLKLEPRSWFIKTRRGSRERLGAGGGKGDPSLPAVA